MRFFKKCKYNGTYLFVIFGKTFLVKDTTKIKLTYIERKEIVKGIKFGKYYLRRAFK